MRPISPWRLIGVGAVLEVVGVALPLLMVVGVLPSTWVLNGLAFLSGVIGLFLGYLGVTLMVRLHRGRGDAPFTPPEQRR